jgi:predicted transposase/invertase (TIGR01784 family)
MKTDTLFYQLFQSFHSLLFELIDRPVSEAEGYQFSSAEVKEKTFRFDGIFMPMAQDKPIFLVEVQFQPKEDFYWEFLAEIFLYLNQYRPSQDWQAVAIFARRRFEPEIPQHFRELIASGRIARVYLEDWLERQTDSLGIGIVQLVLAPDAKTSELAKRLASKVVQEVDVQSRDRIVKFIETVLVYKFPKLSPQEIEAMFTLSDLKQTRVYQDALKEGERLGEQRGLQMGEQIGEQRGLQMGEQIGEQRGLQIGEQQGLLKVLMRLLTRKFGKVSPRLKARLAKLSVAQLDELADVAFDFETIADLQAWLRSHT